MSGGRTARLPQTLLRSNGSTKGGCVRMSGRHVERLKERRVGVLCALTGLTPFGYISVVVPSVAQADVPAPSPSATSAPAQVPCCGGGGSGELLSGQELTAGQAVWSPGGGYYLTMQTDGNLVEYTSSGQALWASDTNSEPGNYAVMQTDGNLVVYSSGGQWIWQTRTNGYGGAYLAVQDDSNVVVYSSSSSALWAKSWNSSVTGAQRYAQQIFFHYGWNVSQQYQYLNDLWTRESNLAVGRLLWIPERAILPELSLHIRCLRNTASASELKNGIGYNEPNGWSRLDDRRTHPSRLGAELHL